MNPEFFKNAFAQAGLSLRSVALRMSMDPSALSRAINGTRRLTISEAGRLSEILSIPLEDILGEAGAPKILLNQRKQTDLSAMSEQELLDLREDVQQELNKRKKRAEVEEKLTSIGLSLSDIQKLL